MVTGYFLIFCPNYALAKRYGFLSFDGVPNRALFDFDKACIIQYDMHF
jgi:hypothetical protein